MSVFPTEDLRFVSNVNIEKRSEKPRIKFLERIAAFAISNSLPLGFLFATIFAFGYPPLGRRVSSIRQYHVSVLQAVNSINVFFISGVTLDIQEAGAAMSRWHTLIFGSAIILFVTPLFAFVTI